jgi:5'-3' exonuclease
LSSSSIPPQRYVLIDAGYFIGRQTRWWRPRASPRRRWGIYKNNPTTENYSKYIESCAKELKKDIGFLKFRINNSGFGKPDTKIIVCYDGVQGKIKRLNKFEAYKAHRNAGSEFKSEDGSIPDLRKNFIEYGYDPSALVSFSRTSRMTDWSSLYEADKEADDLIAEKVLSILTDRDSFNNHPDKFNPKILIISSDADLWQLWKYTDPTTPKTFLGNTADPSDPIVPTSILFHNMKEIITPDSAMESLRTTKASKSGTYSTSLPSWSLYADLKSITGDPSDNIPGCPDTGFARASRLITTYQGLEYIPDEYLTIYFVADPKYISEKLEAWRVENNYTYKYCIETYGNFCKSLMKQEIKKIWGEDYLKIKDIVGDQGFVSTNYKSHCLTYREIIKLPFDC